jgi:hypothetical protein
MTRQSPRVKLGYDLHPQSQVTPAFNSFRYEPGRSTYLSL